MGFRYLVLGAGVGKAIAAWLLEQEDTEEVVIADADQDRALQAASIARKAAGLRSRHNTNSCYALRLHTEADMVALPAYFAKFSSVISALPAWLNPRLARCAVQGRTNFCDLGGVVPVTREMLEFNADAVTMGISVIPDCGLMPGLGNIMAYHLFDLLREHSPVSIVVSVGGLPRYPAPPTNYQLTYSLQGLEHMCYDPAPVVRDGKVVEIGPFSEQYELRIPELTRLCPQFPVVEAFPSSGAALAPWTLAEQGVSRFTELTVRWPGFAEAFAGLPGEKFRACAETLPKTDCSTPDLVFMDVAVESANGPRYGYRLVDHYDQESGLSAMERCTGFSTAIFAHWQAQGKIEPGARTADQAFSRGGSRQAYLDAFKNRIPYSFRAENED